LLPENYGISTNVDFNSSNPFAYPGDLRSWDGFNIPTNNTGQVTIDLAQLIHLIKPVDNNKPIYNWHAKCEEKTSHDGTITFEWNPLATDTYYEYKVRKSICDPFAYGEVIASGTIQETKVTIDLEPSSSTNNIYIFTLSARKDGKHIGFFMVHGDTGGLGWDYRFRVK